MGEGEERRHGHDRPDPKQLFADSKELFDKFMEFIGMQGMKSEAASDTKAAEAYIQNLKVFADSGCHVAQMPAFKLHEWAGRDRGHYDADVMQRQKHTANLDSLNLAKVSANQLATSIAELGASSTYLHFCNLLMNVDEQPAWLARILRSETYGDSVLSLTIMYLAKASGVTLNENTFKELFEGIKSLLEAAKK